MVQRACLSTLAVLLIVLMLAIVTQIVCSALGINPLLDHGVAWPLVGKAISLNTLLDLQWHLLAVTGMLPLGLVWLGDRHVRVDFFYNRHTPRWKAWLNILGNLVFAAPFFCLVLPACWSFVRRAWISDEASRHGGLNDLWLVKAVLPLGLGLLSLAIVIETVRLIRVVYRARR